MRKYIELAIVIILAINLCTCATAKMEESETYLTIRINDKVDELTISKNYLNNYIGKNNTSIVLRVPTISQGITSEDTNNGFYIDLEKKLMQSGFVVRDRALLESLLVAQNTDKGYSSIYEKIDTDLILQIDNIKLDQKYYPNEYIIDGVKYYDDKNNEYFVQYAEIDARVVMIKEGEIGEIIRIFSLNTNEIGEVRYTLIKKSIMNDVFGLLEPTKYTEIAKVEPGNDINQYTKLIFKLINVIQYGRAGK